MLDASSGPRRSARPKRVRSAMGTETLERVPADGAPRNRSCKAWWVEPLAPYARADAKRAIWCLATSVAAYLALWPAMYYLLRVSYALTLLVALPASGFLVRTFIVFH